MSTTTTFNFITEGPDTTDNEGENVFYSFPVLDGFEKNGANEKGSPLVLELVPLPLLSENFEQMPVGAKGWYASAVLSAMMMISYSSSGCSDFGEEEKDDIGESSKGIDLLRDDLKRACNCGNTATLEKTTRDNVFLELGSGTIGLAGMTMAWIVAQHQQSLTCAAAAHRILLTDYDPICLEQLERNAGGVRQRLGDYFSTARVQLPDIRVGHLDWNEFDRDQSPILLDDKSSSSSTISFVCGAALVYTEQTAACADQVAKVLTIHPEASVWVVQWPRGGWFQVFQQELLSARCTSENLRVRIEKFGPGSSPELFSEEVQALARTLMPETMQQESQMNIKDLRAVRITNAIAKPPQKAVC